MWLVKNAISAIDRYCGTTSCCVSMKTTRILVKWLYALLFDTLFSFINQHFLFHSNFGSLADLIFLIASHQVSIQSLFPHRHPPKRLLPVVPLAGLSQLRAGSAAGFFLTSRPALALLSPSLILLPELPGRHSYSPCSIIPSLAAISIRGPTTMGRLRCSEGRRHLAEAKAWGLQAQPSAISRCFTPPSALSSDTLHTARHGTRPLHFTGTPKDTFLFNRKTSMWVAKGLQTLPSFFNNLLCFFKCALKKILWLWGDS